MDIQMIDVIIAIVALSIGAWWYHIIVNQKLKTINQDKQKLDQELRSINEKASTIEKQSEHRLLEAEKKELIANQRLETADTRLKDADTKMNQASQTLTTSETKAKEIISEAQKEYDKRMQKIDSMESRLTEKEERVDKKLESLEDLKIQLVEKEKEIVDLVQEQQVKLSQIANLTPQEAKEKLFESIEHEHKAEIIKFADKYKTLMQGEMDTEAINLISKALPRIASECVSEYTTISVDIPTEETKGKLIWREGRNVTSFERVTGVELLIDDTPLVVKLSSYDAEKRFLAAETLKRLIKDGRINPVYIEKMYTELSKNMDELLMNKGKEALQIVNLPAQHPDILKMIGQFRFRYSYGQNLRIHSIEVAKLAEVMANELGLDGTLAKKAWLLHDIGKIMTAQWGSHTKIWWEILRKYGYDEVTVNTAEWHHHDIPLTHPIGWVVTAADALSASRPGARFETKQFFIEKMEELQKLISSVSWVDKVYIMQAGREIMIFVNPTQIDDLGVQKLIKEVGQKVEDQLDYPGIIRVVAIRETKVVDFLR